MGSRPFCDRCKKDVTTRNDLYLAQIENCVTRKPAMMAWEVCTWCKEEIKKFIADYGDYKDEAKYTRSFA